MRLKQVVLPAPLGPMRLTISPFCTVKETSATAAMPPKLFATLRTSSIGDLPCDWRGGRGSGIRETRLAAADQEAHQPIGNEDDHQDHDGAEDRELQLLEVAQ